MMLPQLDLFNFAQQKVWFCYVVLDFKGVQRIRSQFYQIQIRIRGSGFEKSDPDLDPAYLYNCELTLLFCNMSYFISLKSVGL